MKNKLALFFLLFTKFATAQFGIGTNSPAQKLHILGDTAQPAASGSANNAILRISNTANAAVIDFGQSKDNYSWIQSRNSSNYNTSYPLIINPNGGNVGINNSTPAAKLAVTGNVSATGTIRSTAAGQLLNCKFLNETDLGLSGQTDVATTTETTVASYSYTPVSSSSKIFIEFDSRGFITGGAADELAAHIYVGSTNIQSNKILFSSGQGGGGRGNTLFPITGYYLNSGTSALTISIKVNRVSSDDTITVIHDNTLIIKEVAQ